MILFVKFAIMSILEKMKSLAKNTHLLKLEVSKEYPYLLKQTLLVEDTEEVVRHLYYKSNNNLFFMCRARSEQELKEQQEQINSTTLWIDFKEQFQANKFIDLCSIKPIKKTCRSCKHERYCLQVPFKIDDNEAENCWSCAFCLNIVIDKFKKNYQAHLTNQDKDEKTINQLSQVIIISEELLNLWKSVWNTPT